MPRAITPNSMIKKCPKCHSRMTYGHLGSGKKTVCECGYEEPEGSLHMTTFACRLMSLYMERRGIENVMVGPEKMKMVTALSPVGMSPFIVMRTNHLLNVGGDAPRVTGERPMFKLVTDKMSNYNMRITSAHTYTDVNDVIGHFAMQLKIMTYVIDETINNTKMRLQTNRVNTFQFRDIATFGDSIAPKDEAPLPQATKDNNRFTPGAR